MARKKELMELENPSMEGNNPLDGTGTEGVAFPGEGEGTPPEADGDGMDLNELLGSMDQEPAAAPDLAEGDLPELTEEEIFGEGPEGSGGTRNRQHPCKDQTHHPQKERKNRDAGGHGCRTWQRA